MSHRNSVRKYNKKRSSNTLKYCGYAACFVLIAVGVWITSRASEAQSTPNETEQVSNRDNNDLLSVTAPKGLKSVNLEYPGFTIEYNPKYKQPNWVAWELTREKANADKYSRNDADFFPDPNVPDGPTLADYKGSGYDRGHMCPAGDMKWSLDGMRSCFYLTNMSPQSHELNNGSWKSLEEKCREWANRDSSIIIVCGPVLSDKMTNSIGDNKIPVPERYFKVVLAPYANPIRAIGFIMPNGKVKGGMQAVAVSVDEVESITGFDFFSSLPDDIENKIEAECNFPRWSQR